jgi:hypothetical protein
MTKRTFYTPIEKELILEARKLPLSKNREARYEELAIEFDRPLTSIKSQGYLMFQKEKEETIEVQNASFVWEPIVSTTTAPLKLEDRLEVEQKALEEKIIALSKFTIGDRFRSASLIQQSLLKVQLNAMLTYERCLIERIEHLNSKEV